MTKTAANNFGLTGVVLAGGLSSRLGTDKAALMLDGSETLLMRTVKLLLKAVPKVLVAGRVDAELEALPGVECIPDNWPGCGPVGGIASALLHSGTDCLALSCDLPFMTGQVLDKLVASWASRRPDTLLCAYSQAGTGKTENLAGIYSQEALKLFQDTLAKKLLKISLVIPKEREERLPYDLEESLPFFNINYPADLMLAREYLKLKAAKA